MARFDVYEYGRYGIDYMVDIQADILSHLETRLVAPLVKPGAFKNEEYERLKPALTFMKKKYILMTPDMAALSIADLGKVKGNLKEHHHTIVDSIDFLLQGF